MDAKHITYRIRSGDLDARVETAHPARPLQLAVMALDRLRHLERPLRLGELIEVTGGAYVGGATQYIATAGLLREMGFEVAA